MKQFVWFLCWLLIGLLPIHAQQLKPVSEQGKWGYQDTAGNWVIAPTFTQAGPFSKQLALAPVAQGRQWGFIDMNGRFIIGCFFDEVGKEFVSGVVEVCQNGKWGFIDLNGQMLIPIKYGRSKYNDYRDKAVRKVRKMRNERRYEWVERKINEAAEQAKNKIESAAKQ